MSASDTPHRQPRRTPISRVLHARGVWRDTMSRVQRLEDRHDETDRLLDAVFSDTVYQHGEAGLNGQVGRKQLVQDLFDRFRFAMAVETGTHFGTTTGYLACEYDVPVHTCELTSRYFYAARQLLRELSDVHVHRLDSRALLRELAAAGQTPSLRTFFYLDAHWYDDLPLAEELDLIATHWTEWVVIVDDFRVPDDAGYGYDEYEGGLRLALDYVAPVLQRHGLDAFFPTLSSAQETGARRGCLVTSAPSLSNTLGESSFVRKWRSASE
jgi:hypothetical protein